MLILKFYLFYFIHLINYHNLVILQAYLLYFLLHFLFLRL